MTDIVLDFELDSEDADVQLSEAIDTFLTLQESAVRDDPFDLDLMVRTVFGPGGERLKRLVFQQREIANAFDSFWSSFRRAS
ncbi:MAG: hypothetical protein FP825_05580 [Hyphomonas sp.]|uniref:hypothetical protein n=1 Tax=Hyphomonas sp. TaxID=87 RepID=UPI00184A2123|nr:hypothetical protein [Hyphomonas sp.]MBA3067939.1 hypothetical protein [Hyphomonas sp.]MBU3919567.1 hypothetical protein [Alphaproteobacteria bacterium]MBU4061277.1 hypothetical protein [Alphaproteobacteria bacterium]MBU4162530.1 hypothetical protein [Alphaproteobacteria bacterium]